MPGIPAPLEFSGDKLRNWIYTLMVMFINLQIVYGKAAGSKDDQEGARDAWAVSTGCLFASLSIAWFHWQNDQDVSGKVSYLCELFFLVAYICFWIMMWAIFDGRDFGGFGEFIFGAIWIIVTIYGLYIRFTGGGAGGSAAVAANK